MDTALTLPGDKVDELRKATPSPYIQKRKGPSGMMLSYVDTGYVTAQLNKIFGHVWSFEVVREGRDGEHIWVLGRLRVLLAPDVVITKEQYGSAKIKTFSDKTVAKAAVSIGDDYKAAASDAMKKCASMLGLASDIYHPKVHETTAKLKKELDDKAAKESI